MIFLFSSVSSPLGLFSVSFLSVVTLGFHLVVLIEGSPLGLFSVSYLSVMTLGFHLVVVVEAEKIVILVFSFVLSFRTSKSTVRDFVSFSEELCPLSLHIHSIHLL